MSSAQYHRLMTFPNLPLLQIFPPEDWLIASSVPSKFSPDAIQSILNDLTPDKVR